jgi:hypothetical protein
MPPEPTARAVIQIVSQLPPTLGGVGGYALSLARGLRDYAGVATRFLLTDPAWHGEGWSEPGLTVRPLTELTAGALRRALEELAGDGSPVLLHYANYGYERRGCPRWLVRAIASWRLASPARLLTFFHEVYASGPPSSSSFWLGPIQRRLAARLVGLSDRTATSLTLYADLLEGLAPGAGAGVYPVLSPLGEPANTTPLAARQRHLVVFGGPGARRAAYGPHRETLAAACRELAVEEVLDVGAPLDDTLPRDVGGVPLRPLGPLSDAAASDLLGRAFAGFIAHRPEMLGKSTIFASLCSHGVLPVGSTPDGEILWAPGDPSAPADLQAVATASRTWYLQHAAPRLAASFHELLFA